MESKAKVRFSAFTELQQSKLVPYALTVVNMMTTNPAYADYATLVSNISAAADTFQQSLAKVKEGGKGVTATKNVAKENLISAMRAVVHKFEGDPLVNAAFILNAGFDLVNSTPNKHLNPLNAPQIAFVKNNGQRGQLLIKINPASLAPGTLQMALEYSTNEGESWQNGQYFSSKNYLATNLPASMNMKIRVRATGTRARVSPWSEMENCFVS